MKTAYISVVLSAKHDVNSFPRGGGDLTTNELTGDVRFHRGKKMAKNPLVYSPPVKVHQVRNVHSGVTGSFLDRLRGSHLGAIKMTVETRAGEVGKGEPYQSMKLPASRRTGTVRARPTGTIEAKAEVMAPMEVET